MKELEDGEELAILKFPGWWVRDDKVVGFGQISPKGGVNHILWGTSAGAEWTPCSPGTVVVIQAKSVAAWTHLAYVYARAIRVRRAR